MIKGDQSAVQLDKDAVWRLTARICAVAGYRARSTAQLIELIGELDAGGGLAHLHGAKSVAHWVSYGCSMDLGAAREHVRVARALPVLPVCAAAFRAGELSYSKMRALTRVAGVVADAELCELALAATAEQLVAMLAGYRRAKGTRMKQKARRRFSLVAGASGETARVTGELATEEAALVDAALQRARDLHAVPVAPEAKTTEEQAGSAAPDYTNLDALLDICQHYLNSAVSEDESGEDRSLVIIEVSADQLDAVPADVSAADLSENRSHQDVSAETSSSSPRSFGAHACAETSPADPAGSASTPDPSRETSAVNANPGGSRRDVSAETSAQTQLCQVRGQGGIEPATAQRMLCTASLLGAIIDRHGDVLALGHTRRLVSKAQRRALLLRDRTCQFPSCRQRRHLQAHHVVPWSHGGRTDLDNLISLCRYHHTCVHEGDVTIATRTQPVYTGSGRVPDAWQFTLPDGEPVASTGWKVMTADRLTRELIDQLDEPDLNQVEDFHHPDANAIRPRQCGEPFDLHACVQALFNIEIHQDQHSAA